MTTTWAGGIIPVEGDKVTVVVGDTVTPTGTHIWGDDTTSAITISGTLKASRVANSSLQCKGDLVTSATTTATIDYGRRSTSDPIPAGITATLILNYSAALSNFKYGLYIADTSNFYACGQTTNPNTTLTAGIAVAATTCVVADITGWVVGDTFVLGVSDGTYNHYDKKVITTITA